MKELKLFGIIFIGLFCLIFPYLSALTQNNVGIGTTTPDNSALLELYSTSHGFLVPRLTTTQRNAISSPATGLLIYNLDNQRFEYFNGTQWIGIISSVATVPFSLISTGTNTSATMTVGSGASIVVGGGTIESNVFKGSGSVTNAVDLSTGEVAGVLPVANGGTGLSSIPSNGQILIGNGSGYSLSTLTAGNGITITNASGSITISDANAGTEVVGSGSVGQVAFWSASNTIAGDNNLFWDNTNGRLGIGTTNPQTRLEIQGGELWVFNNGNNTRFVIGDNGSTGQYGWLQWDSNLDLFRIDHSSYPGDGLKLNGNFMTIGNVFPNDPLIVAYGTNELLRVKTSGNVGIGVTNPTEKLDISGNLKISGAFMPNGNAGTSGQVLISQGTNNPPIWSSSISTLESDPIWTAAKSGTETISGNWTFNNTITGNISGNAGTATALQTARNFSISGDATGGPVSFNGTLDVNISIDLSANVVTSTEIADGSITNADINPNAGIDVSKISVTQNNIIVGNSSNVGSLLTPGNNGDVLGISGGAPTWVNPNSLISAWSLSGNSLSGTERIGSTNNQPVTLVTNNVDRFRFTTLGQIEVLNSGKSVFIGEGAGNSQDNTSDRGSTFIGYQSGYSNTTGYTNTAVGARSLYANTTGYQNTVIGAVALENNTTGYSNSAIGLGALNSNTSGSENVAIGVGSLYSNTSGGYNVAIGNSSLSSLVSNDGNVAIGYKALENFSGGNDNTGIGNGVSIMNNLSNATAIGARARVEQSNSIVLGSIAGINGASATVNVGIGTTTPSERLDVEGNFRLSGAFMPNGNAGTSGQVLISQGTNNPPIWSSSISTLESDPIWTAAINGTQTITGNWDFTGGFKLFGRQFDNSSPTQGQVYRWNGITGKWEPSDVGSVVSVGLMMPSEFSVSGSPITNSGTFMVNWNTTGANTVLAGPISGTGTPSFRTLTDDDIPDNITASNYLPLSGGTMTGVINFASGQTFPGTVTGGGSPPYIPIWSGGSSLTYDYRLQWSSASDALVIQNSIGLVNSGSGSNYLKTRSDQTVAITYSLPTTITANGFLKTDAIGNLSWETIQTVPIGTIGQTLRYNSGWEATNLIYHDVANNRVGINITTPSVLLHQDQGTNTATYHKFTAGSTTGTGLSDGFDIGIDGSGDALIKQNENAPIIFQTNGTERMRLLANGKLGIGTTTVVDSVLVQTNGDVYIDGDLIVTGNIDPKVIFYQPLSMPPSTNLIGATYFDDVLERILIRKSNGWDTLATRVDVLNSNNNNWKTTGNSGTNPGTHFVGTIDNRDLVFKTNNSERMRIRSDGRVGIGTNEPDYTLHIYSATNPQIGLFGMGEDANVYGTLFGLTANDFDFYIQDAGESTIPFLIQRGTGNIGIGIQNPSDHLHIRDGAIRVDYTDNQRSARVTADGGIELYRGNSAPNSQVNGYIDFKNSENDDYDFRLTYNHSLGTNGGFQFISTTNGMPSTEQARITILNENGNVGIGTTSPSSTLSVNGSIENKVTIVTSNLTLDGTHHTILANSTSSITITLPSASVSTGRIYVIKNINTGIVTISGSIEGSSSMTLYEKQSVELVSNGSMWVVTSSYQPVPPIGSIIAWHKDFSNTPSLPYGWVECNGQTLNDPASPYHNQVIPNLNGDPNGANSPGLSEKVGMFLRGGTTSGTGQNDAFQGHKHNLSSDAVNGNLQIDNNGVFNQNNANYILSSATISVENPTSDGTNGTPRTSNETRPKNMSVVWIMRVK